jgi:hypothetical protein
MKINKENYRDILWRHLENELSPAEKSETEQYIRNNEEATREWDLLKKTRLIPDHKIVFPKKQLLYREEEDKKPALIISLLRYSAITAAAAILILGIYIYTGKTYKNNNIASSPVNHGKMDVTAENIPGKKKGNSNKDSENKGANNKAGNVKKGQKSNPGATKKDLKAPKPQKVEEKHPTILIVDQVEKNNPMAFIQTGSRNEIDNNYDNGINVSQPLKISNQNSISKQSTDYYADDSKNLVDLFFDLRKKVSLKKKQENNKTYYALSIETNDMKINKTFK